MSDSNTRDIGLESDQDQPTGKAKVWRAPKLEITTIAAATAAKGHNPVEVGPFTGPLPHS
jgi:hypothetical protein